MGDTTLDIFGPDSRDPFRDLNPFKGTGLAGNGARRGREPAAYPPLSAEEAEPLKEGLLDRTVSGIQYAGSSLDKAFGGRAVRGLLAGKPRELLSAIPFSDTIGLTATKDATSGADLLKGAGWDTSKGNWATRNLLPMAVEIGLDPGSYLNPLGALTKAGKVASGLGHTAGWSRRALTEGFTHSEPALRALGETTEAIAHIGRQKGVRIASQDLIDKALALGIDLKPGMPLRGAVGVGLPFRDPLAVFGTGARSQALAGAMDRTGAAIGKLPMMGHLGAMFDPARMGSEHHGVAAAARAAGRPAQEAAASAARLTEAELRTQADEVIKGFRSLPGMESEALRVMRSGLEDASPIYTDKGRWSDDLTRRFHTIFRDKVDPTKFRRLATGVEDLEAVRKHILDHWDELQDVGRGHDDYFKAILRGAEDQGTDAAGLVDDTIRYGARSHISAQPGFEGTAQGKLLATKHGSNIRRKTPLSKIPGGSEQINEWVIDPRLSGSVRTLAPDQVQAHVYADMERHILAKLPPAEQAAALKSARGKAREVEKYLAKVDDAHAAHGIPYFNPDVIADLAMRGQRHARVTGSAATLTKGATDLAEPVADFAGRGEKPAVLLGDFFKTGGRGGLQTTYKDVRFTPAEDAAVAAAGFKNRDELFQVAMDPTPGPADLARLAALPAGLAAKSQVREHMGAAIRAYEHMAARGFDNATEAAAGRVNFMDELNQFGLSDANAAALTRMHQGWVAPTEMRPFLRWMGGANSLFKNAVYPIWPASHVRNAAGAAYNNFLDGTGLRDYFDAWRVMHDGRVKDPTRYAATAAMTPEQAATTLRQTAYADAKVGGHGGSYAERFGGGRDDDRLTQALKGDRRISAPAPGAPSEAGFWRDTGDALTAKGAWNPFNQQGVGGGWLDRRLRGANAAPRTEDTFALLKVGRAAGTKIEDTARMANYLGGLRKGMSSPMAGQRTRAIHFDYQDLTPSERALKSLIPFYTFARKNLPYQLRMAATAPNKVLPTLHAMGATDPNKPWVPEYLASGAAIPIGGANEDGTQRFLSKFGLPLEEAFERFKFRNYEVPGGGDGTTNLPSLGGTALAFAGMASPYLKGPLEYMTDTQFHTRRKLSDLHAKGVAGGFGIVPEELAQPLTQLVANSPLARLAATTNTLADPRKGGQIKALNLLTGLRISDVDLEKQRAIATRKELEGLLASEPDVSEFRNFYARPGATIEPRLVQQLRLFASLKGDAKAYHLEQQRRDRLRQLQGGLRPGL